MFRIIFSMFLLAMSLGAISAGGQPAATNPTSHEQRVETAKASSLDVRRYVQAELDWRSYYLNRAPSARAVDVPVQLTATDRSR